MKLPLLNALTLFIGVCIVVIAFGGFWFGNGESVATVSKILFAPFLLDISRGVGDFAAQLFRWVTLGSYLLVIAMVVFRYRAKENSAQSFLSIFGIILTIIHFSIVGLGYLTTGLH